jgi:hypothetical protein
MNVPEGKRLPRKTDLFWMLMRFVSFHPMVGTHILLRLSGSTWCGATGLARCPNESRQLLMRKLKRYQSFQSWLD